MATVDWMTVTTVEAARRIKRARDRAACKVATLANDAGEGKFGVGLVYG